MTHCPKPDSGLHPHGRDLPVIKASVFVGADPGLRGALAFYDAVTGGFSVHDTPTRWIVRAGKRRRQVDAVALGTLLDVHTAGRDVLAFVEQVHAMPGQGVSSTFSFGRAAGVLDGELGAQGVDPTYVVPRVWMAQSGIAPRSDKHEHRRIAALRWPEHAARFARAKDDGRADAALILAWGIQQQGVK